MFDVLLDGTTEPRLNLVSKDEAGALMILLGVLEENAPTEEIHQAAGDMRFRLASRLAWDPTNS
ncbi:hypothetical protein [Streptomyces sp. H34-S4]|uniref:hypothetical protein n=1 Tax=Streptomyces sp. H34-S4 TaxID=2996463 RepID=UPI00226D89CA|nr:hypothetical protein [Streptomyces sp. H34-S4]MCY0939359.1 hypothetical protein [Streptomyces sp. H34-S4]